MFTDFVVVGVQPTDVARFYEVPAMYRPVEVVVTRDFVTVSELIFCPLTVCPYELCVFAGHGEVASARIVWSNDHGSGCIVQMADPYMSQDDQYP